MPETSNHAPLFSGVPFLWIIMISVATSMAFPITHAWFHDPSLRFGLPSFLLWSLAVVLRWRRFPRIWRRSEIFLVVLACISLCLGIAGELQALVYPAWAVLFSLPVRGGLFEHLCFALLAVIWMPASAWLLYPLMGPALPWIAVAVALLLLILSLSGRLSRHAPETGHHSI